MWLSDCAVLLYAVQMACIAFLFGVWDMMSNSIVSVSDHCIFIYSVEHTNETSAMQA